MTDDPNINPEQDLPALLLRAIGDPGNFPVPGNAKGERTVSEWSRDAVVTLLASLQQPLADQLAAVSDELIQLNDRALRMEAALRLVRIKVMGDLVDPESGVLRDWLRDWIDGFDNGVVTHGPIGGPMLWPAQAPGIVRQLLLWGFSAVDGPHGIKYAALLRAPQDGEAVQ